MASTSSPQDIVRQFHLDRQKIGLKPKNNLQQVEKYFHRGHVSIVTPDLKKARKKHPISIRISTGTASQIPGR